MTWWEQVVEGARKALETCDCSEACYRCLLNFQNQQHHEVLSRHRALNALTECRGTYQKELDIPANLVEAPATGLGMDSTSEESFLRILRNRSFPLPPQNQFRVDLGGGSYTLADFAYPDARILVFVDGLSNRLHGNPDQRERDRRARTKARALGWQVCEISAQGLSDEVMLRDFLETLGILLGREEK